MLERWLSRLAKSKYKKNFIFKGALCLQCYLEIQRETRDLDFALKDLQGNIENIQKYFGEVSSSNIDDGFSFDLLNVQLLAHAHMQYPGYSISVVGHLGKTKTKIFIDVGVGDVVKPTEITMRLLETDKAPLFEKDISLWAYPVESIFAEKLQTAIAQSNQNSRMKDYHDLLCLLRNDVINILRLKTAIRQTFSHRGTALGLIQIKKFDIEKIQNYWTHYLRTLSGKAKQELSTDFKSIIDEINQFLAKHFLVFAQQREED